MSTLPHICEKQHSSAESSCTAIQTLLIGLYKSSPNLCQLLHNNIIACLNKNIITLLYTKNMHQFPELIVDVSSHALFVSDPINAPSTSKISGCVILKGATPVPIDQLVMVYEPIHSDKSRSYLVRY